MPESKFGFVGKVIVERVYEDGSTRTDEYYNSVRAPLRTAAAKMIANTGPVPPSHIGIGSGALANYGLSNRSSGDYLKHAGAGDREILAQEFQVTTNGSVSRALLNLRRVGHTTATLWVEIQTDASGFPSGTPVTNGVSDPIQFNAVPTTVDEWVAFEFATPPSLTTGTVYHLVLRSSGYTFTDSVLSVEWGADITSPSYASGTSERYDGTTWTDVTTQDYIFRVVGTVDPSRTTLLAQLDRNAITSGTNPSSTSARLVAVFNSTEAVDYIAEVGLFDDPTAGNLLAVAAVDVIKENRTLNVYWVFDVVEVPA